MKRLAAWGVFFLVPGLAQAAITVTEVAWMGTSTSQYEEWFELHNDGETAVSLSGWKAFKSGGTALYTLTGSIDPGTYYVVCRTTASLNNPLAGNCNEQGPWGGSGLNNTSDQLILKDNAGTSIDSIDAVAGWPAGESSTKKTMQKSGNEWVTAAATPGAETVAQNSDDPNQSAADENGPSQPPVIVKRDSKEKIEKIKPDPIYEAHMFAPDYGFAGIAVPLRAEVRKDKILTTLRGRYVWSFGDGGSSEFKKNEPVEHTYQYPGVYTIVLAYYSDPFREDPDTIHRKQITIAPDSVIMTRTADGGIALDNESGKEVDVWNWSIRDGGQVFTFPKYTTIASGATLRVAPQVLGFSVSSHAILYSPSGIPIVRHTISSEAQESDESVVAKPAIAPNAKESAPSSHRSNHLLHDYGWYAGFGAFALAAAVAYFLRRLYASESEFEEDEVGEIL